MVIFTDGAINAGRFLLSAPTGIAQNITAPGNYDYTHYSLKWTVPAAPDPDITYYGPSLLVTSNSNLFQRTDPAPPSENIAPCSGYATQAPSDPDQFNSIFEPCISNFGFHAPRETTVTFGENYGGISRPYETTWNEQYLNASISLTDWLRDKNVGIFAVGLGEQAMSIEDAIASNDPYQNINDGNGRKDVFGARLANDYRQGVTESQLTKGDKHPEPSYAGYRSYSELKAAEGMGAQGIYKATPNSSELDLLFSAIAQKILLRLIE